MALDKQFLDAVRNPIQITWEQIGQDALEFCENNEQAVEMCIDADRLLLNGEDRVTHALVRETIGANGYTKTLKFLATNITLV